MIPPMKRLVGYFARGCLALIPVSLIVYLLLTIVSVTDDLLGLSIPGLGLVIALGLITAVGFLISNVVGRRIYQFYDSVMARLPVIKLFYTSIRDLLQTIVGDKTAIGRPVSVCFGDGDGVRLLGLLTQENLNALGLPDHVAVYLPQAYNIGGQVVAVRRDLVENVDVRSSEMLAFMMSGGAASPTPQIHAAPP